MVAYTFYEQDNRVRRYAEALVRRGDHVDAVAVRKEGQPSKEIIEGVTVYRIQRRVTTEKGKLTYLAKMVVFLVHSFFFLSWKQFQERYDLVHVHSIPDFEVFAALVPKLTGSKIILDIHDLVPEFYSSKFKSSTNSLGFKVLVFLERMSASFADHVIAANHLWLNRLYERSVREERCTVVLNYPDTAIFRFRGRTRNDGRFIMVYPGSLNYHQGVDIAVRAFALIADQAPNAEFHIYGGMERHHNLGALIDELGLQKRVLIKASRPMQEIAEIMENSDLGIVAKRSDGFGNEAFSTKIFEFMCLDVPVIVPTTAIDRYYFNDSVVKFFTANDEKSPSAAMIELIQNPEERRELARNARQFIQSYTWDKNCSVYLNLVDSLVTTAARSAVAKGCADRPAAPLR